MLLIWNWFKVVPSQLPNRFKSFKTKIPRNFPYYIFIYKKMLESNFHGFHRSRLIGWWEVWSMYFDRWWFCTSPSLEWKDVNSVIEAHYIKWIGLMTTSVPSRQQNPMTEHESVSILFSRKVNQLQLCTTISKQGYHWCVTPERNPRYHWRVQSFSFKMIPCFLLVNI